MDPVWEVLSPDISMFDSAKILLQETFPDDSFLFYFYLLT